MEGFIWAHSSMVQSSHWTSYGSNSMQRWSQPDHNQEADGDESLFSLLSDINVVEKPTSGNGATCFVFWVYVLVFPLVSIYNPGSLKLRDPLAVPLECWN